MNISKLYLMLLLLAAFMLSEGCGGGNPIIPFDPGPVIELPYTTLILDGWQKYEAGNFSGAINKFVEAKKLDAAPSDSYNGLGWSYFRAHNLVLSLFNFRIPRDSDSTNTDVNVGYAISAFEKNEFLESIDAIIFVTNQDSSKFNLEGTDEYFFEHDQDVTSRDVRRILALSYYFTGDFQSAYLQLINFLDPLSQIDPAAENFKIKLLEELEER